MEIAPVTRNIDFVNQILAILEPIPDDQKIRILKILNVYFGLEVEPPQPIRSGATQIDSSGQSSRLGFGQDLPISPKDFLFEKQPRTDVERIACLAFYLANYRETPYFKTVDLSNLNTEAAQPKFANAAVSSNNAQKMGYLASAGHGSRQLSAAGEQFVRALPDRETAKKVMESAHRRRRMRPADKRQEQVASS
jgi:hypothetical protein